MKTPGTRIKGERNRLGWSQQKLADEITRIKGEKISRAAVAQWEIGTSKTQTPENFFAAAKALGLNPYWVLNEDGEKYLEGDPVRVTVLTKQNVIRVKTPQPPTAIEELTRIAGSISEDGLKALMSYAYHVEKQHPAQSKQTRKSSQ